MSVSFLNDLTPSDDGHETAWEPLSEHDARMLLRDVASPAHDREKYVASRTERGWVLEWDASQGVKAPVGMGRWVVADNGRLARVHLGTTPHRAMAELLG